MQWRAERRNEKGSAGLIAPVTSTESASSVTTLIAEDAGMGKPRADELGTENPKEGMEEEFDTENPADVAEKQSWLTEVIAEFAPGKPGDSTADGFETEISTVGDSGTEKASTAEAGTENSPSVEPGPE